MEAKYNAGDKYYELTANIELKDWGTYAAGSEGEKEKVAEANWKTIYSAGDKGVGGWVPIGENGKPFKANFDGDGKIVKNMTINRSGGYQGLFGCTTGSEIKNIGVVNVNIKGSGYLGGLVGLNNSLISNSYATGNVKGTTNNVGGLVGLSNGKESSISNSYATASVSGGTYVGGLVGQNKSIISNTYATGNVEGTGVDIGGLVGLNNSLISNTYATGSVKGTTNNVGGLVGQNSNSGKISNSYATGNVSGDYYVGGLVGQNNSDTISNSVALNPSVSGTGNNVERIVGKNYDGIFTNNYAWKGMKVKEKSVEKSVDGNANNENGADIIARQIVSGNAFWKAGSGANPSGPGFNAESPEVWQIVDKKLPCLLGFGGKNDTGAQNCEIPRHITIPITFTPEIDYQNEQIVGLNPSLTYSFSTDDTPNCSPGVSNASTYALSNLNLPNNPGGDEVEVKVAVCTAGGIDASSTRTLLIPAREQAPANLGVKNRVDGGTEGKAGAITATTAQMEYALLSAGDDCDEGGLAWKNAGDGETKLAPDELGKYCVRLKASNGEEKVQSVNIMNAVFAPNQLAASATKRFHSASTAVEIKQAWTVSFALNGADSGTTAPSAQEIENAQTMQNLENYAAPTKHGYDLQGWYDGTACDNQYFDANGKANPGKPITKTTTLYACWKANASAGISATGTETTTMLIVLAFLCLGGGFLARYRYRIY
jgi:hypothetical protein